MRLPKGLIRLGANQLFTSSLVFVDLEVCLWFVFFNVFVLLFWFGLIFCCVGMNNDHHLDL